jgi:hypothetical protein
MRPILRAFGTATLAGCERPDRDCCDLTSRAQHHLGMPGRDIKQTQQPTPTETTYAFVRDRDGRGRSEKVTPSRSGYVPIGRASIRSKGEPSISGDLTVRRDHGHVVIIVGSIEIELSDEDARRLVVALGGV